MVIGHHYMSIRSTFEYYAYMTIFIYILNILSNHFISGVDADMLLSINRGGGGYNYPRTVYTQIYARPIYYPSNRPYNVIKTCILSYNQ